MNNSCHVGGMGRHLAREQIPEIRPSYEMPACDPGACLDRLAGGRRYLSMCSSPGEECTGDHRFRPPSSESM
jgi:hypothetical protein